MQTRYMQRTNSMSRGKRSADDEQEDEQQPERKRPALASVVIEALKFDSLQKLCSSLEPILRRVVSEEVERALAKIGTARLSGRTSPKRIEGSDGRNLQLHFKSKLSLPLFTGGKVEGEQGAAVHVCLIDVNTGLVITSGPEATAKLDVVVLEGDFSIEDQENWPQELFEAHVVKEREGKRPLLTGDVQVTLKEGIGTLGNLTFTDNSSWIKSRKFRLGLRVSSGYCEGLRIREAKTEAFIVKDHRGELYRKHYPPVLTDEVWRLEKIGKDGSFHKRLNSNGIFTVEDFLRLIVRDSAKLRNILGSGMSNKMWEALQEHARTCVLSEKFYVYYPDSTRSVGVIFNYIYALCGLISGDQYHSVDSLLEDQKVFVDSLVKKAYENWNDIVEVDGKSHPSIRQGSKSSNYQIDLPENQLAYLNPSDSSLHLPHLPPYQSAGMRYSAKSQLGNQHLLLGDSSSSRSDNDAMSSHQSSSGFQDASMSALNPFEDWTSHRESGVDETLTEDEIRLRSHELLENDDMQHLLRLFSMGGQNAAEEGFGFPTYVESPMPSYEGRMRSSRVVAGWLKIKAAMRWGFFVRKKAAERRRAQLVELDDD